MYIPQKIKPPIFTTVPMKKTYRQGTRWTRTSYIKAHLAILIPVILLFFYFVATSGSKHPDGPAGSAVVYLARETGPILLAIGAILVIIVITFIATLGRLRDINVNPMWAVLFFVSFLSIPLTIFLSVMPGTKGKNKYGDDPREVKELAQSEIDNLTRNNTSPGERIAVPVQKAEKATALDKLRIYATHKNTASTSQQDKHQEECAALMIDKHELIKKVLRAKELLKIAKIPGTSGSSLKVVCIGFNTTTSKYYLAVSNVGTPASEFQKQYFLNYQLMSKALFEQTGLLIVELANELS